MHKTRSSPLERRGLPTRSVFVHGLQLQHLHISTYDTHDNTYQHTVHVWKQL